MAKHIVPSEFKTHLIEQMLESITEKDNTPYYAFIGDHTSTGVTSADVVQPTNSNRSINIDTYRKMIMGKKLDASSMKTMIKRYNWTSGTVYDMYDDEDTQLSSKQFYIITDETAYYHVYKCLYNNNGAASTTRPLFSDFSADDNYIETDDGYQWKYMYSVASSIVSNFATDSYFPIVANNDVRDAAIAGSIDVIKVIDGGANYNNYISGTFTESDIAINGNNKLFKLANNAALANGFYGNTILHIMDGTAAGLYSNVTYSYSSGDGVIIQLEEALTISANAGSSYQISPRVSITSSGVQTVNAVARAIINANASNSVYKVEVLDAGENYSYATAEILNGVSANSTGGTTGTVIAPTTATIRPILPPALGHGANTASELGGTSLGIYSKFANTENGTVIEGNQFSQFGILRSPAFSNVDINCVKNSNNSIEGFDGSFVKGETFYQFKKLELTGSITIESGNTVIVSDDSESNYDQFLTANDFVFIRDYTSTTYNHISSINAVSNSTSLILNSVPSWSSSNAEIYYAVVTANGIINNTTPTSILANNVSFPIVKGQLIVGANSHAIANVVGIDINERYGNNTAEFDFSTFNQTVKITSVSIPSFIENEFVQQSNTFSARVHTSNTTHLYLTEITGTIDPGINLVGNTSSEILTGSTYNLYSGDVDPNSGSIIYLQNDVAVTRANNQSEEILVILEF